MQYPVRICSTHFLCFVDSALVKFTMTIQTGRKYMADYMADSDPERGENVHANKLFGKCKKHSKRTVKYCCEIT